jgi:cellulose biosynthesis protein BcsQ
MVVAIYNNKGGAGKSTLTSHVGFRAIERNMSITILDIDRQRNTMSWLSKHDNTTEPYNVGSVRVTNDYAEVNNNGLVVIDCPPSFNVVSEIKDSVDVWLIPIDGRFSVDGSMNVLSEIGNTRCVIVVNKAYDSKFGTSELKQIAQLPVDLFRFPIPTQDVVRKAEMLGVSAWKVPYGIRSSTAQNLKLFADWVLDGLKGTSTYTGDDKMYLATNKRSSYGRLG